MNQKDAKRFKKMLDESKRALLVNARKTLMEESNFDTDDLPDEIDLASSEYSQSMIFRLRDREKFLLKKIDKALQRIETGNFGICERCEDEISMKRLEALGCEVALDDFGANAPSYGYLRSVPAHYFKIDSSLVGAAPNDRVARAVISSIVRMAGDLGVQTVAESVESDSELQAMRALGVDFAQGFLMGRPQSLTGYRFPTDIN